MAAYEVLLLNTAIPQIQAAQSGDTYVVPRDIAFSAALTLTAGTANGVPYLNASKVLTTGSALTFDGTNFNTTATTANFGTGGGFALQMGSASTYGYIGNSNSQSFIQINGSANATPNQIQFGIASTEAMRLTSTGLTVQQGAVFNESGADSDFRVESDADTHCLFVDASANNVGIGTNTPSGKLTLGGSGALQQYFISSSATAQDNAIVSLYNNGAAYSQLTHDAAYYTWKTSGIERARISSDGTFRVKGAGTAGTTDSVQFAGGAPASAMTLDASGNLALGSTSILGSTNRASFTNDVTAKGVLALSNTSSSGYSAIELYDNGGTQQGAMGWGNGSVAVTGAASATYLYSTGAITFLSGGTTERARITSGGAFLVGDTTQPGSYRTYIFGTDTLNLSSNGTGTSGTPLRIDRTGSTAGATFALFVSASSTVGSISTDGTNTAYNTSSDYRLKDNQQPLTGSGAFIDALKPKTWDWKSGGKGVGFIAHEVAEVSPGTVVGTKDAVDEEGKPIMQAMEYGSAEFIANIIAELQSLRARVAQLEQGA